MVESENLVRFVSDYIRERISFKAEKTVHDLTDTPLTVHQLQKQKRQLQFLLICVLINSVIIIIIIIIKGDTSNNRGDWDYFKVIQKIREQHTGKA